MNLDRFKKEMTSSEYARHLQIIGIKHDWQKKESSLMADAIYYLYKRCAHLFPLCMRDAVIEEFEAKIKEDESYSYAKRPESTFKLLDANRNRRVEIYKRMLLKVKTVWEL